MNAKKKAEVIGYIDDFLDGRGRPHDWDDFTSGTFYKDRDLDAIVVICAMLPDIYPPKHPRQYCSDEGIEFLRHLLVFLKKS